MRIIDPGHKYSLDILDGIDAANMQEVQLFIFVKREGENYPGNKGAYSGSISQEVIRMLINRTKYVNSQIKFLENTLVIWLLRVILWLLEFRAHRTRNKILLINICNIENISACKKCGHILCAKHPSI